MIRHDPEGHRDIQGILYPRHSNLNSAVTIRQKAVRYPFNFIANGQAYRGLWDKIMVFDALIKLFQKNDLVTLLFQFADNRNRVIAMFPHHTLFGTQGGLGDLGLRRKTGIAAKKNLFYPRTVGRAENGADIIKAANVI